VPYALPAVCLDISSAERQLGQVHATYHVTIWKLGRTVCVYSMVQRREKENNSRYIQEASAPAATPCIRPVTCLRHKYTCNIPCYECEADEVYSTIKGEALSLYTREPGTPWKAMEAHDCKSQWWRVKTRG
jgi:hypothetical protein